MFETRGNGFLSMTVIILDLYEPLGFAFNQVIFKVLGRAKLFQRQAFFSFILQMSASFFKIWVPVAQRLQENLQHTCFSGNLPSSWEGAGSSWGPALCLSYGDDGRSKPC